MKRVQRIFLSSPSTVSSFPSRHILVARGARISQAPAFRNRVCSPSRRMTPSLPGWPSFRLSLWHPLWFSKTSNRKLLDMYRYYVDIYTVCAEYVHVDYTEEILVTRYGKYYLQEVEDEHLFYKR